MIRLAASLAVALLAAAAPALAAPSSALVLKPELAGLGFLVGAWVGGAGKVADTGETSTGSSTIEPAANGAVLLRRDHTALFDAKGRPAGGFDQIMMIYPEGGTLRADYSDGTHVIHYASAAVDPGRAVVFTSAATAGAPVFRLAYTMSAPGVLAVAFSMQPPGGAAFAPIAMGTLRKAP